ncbi:hypothetical protein BDF22DRAFT_679663 [Syncephalis plumigaleata]|nr:hypothetical protein BDF22DRAFT_679663 [Syncephalis plumigaleata]
MALFFSCYSIKKYSLLIFLLHLVAITSAYYEPSRNAPLVSSPTPITSVTSSTNNQPAQPQPTGPLTPYATADYNQDAHDDLVDMSDCSTHYNAAGEACIPNQIPPSVLSDPPRSRRLQRRYSKRGFSQARSKRPTNTPGPTANHLNIKKAGVDSDEEE